VRDKARAKAAAAAASAALAAVTVGVEEVEAAFKDITVWLNTCHRKSMACLTECLCAMFGILPSASLLMCALVHVCCGQYMLCDG